MGRSPVRYALETKLCFVALPPSFRFAEAPITPSPSFLSQRKPMSEIMDRTAYQRPASFGEVSAPARHAQRAVTKPPPRQLSSFMARSREKKISREIYKGRAVLLFCHGPHRSNTGKVKNPDRLRDAQTPRSPRVAARQCRGAKADFHAQTNVSLTF